ncbi:cytochrome P450 [Rickenella mellea]|uniref:Cytochrome P450 n=1 Tax=Rickenella mellea TaxID=50990 RepID=A0A4Y7PQI8_9AGAM|nr:cytochrome P450 [Rickenella mellea]
MDAEILNYISLAKGFLQRLPAYWWGIGLLALLWVARFSYSSLRGRKNLPPGPRGLPILGNVFQLPQFQWLRFTEWKEQYGPIFSLNLAGQPVVVLNSHKVTADLLDRRSNVYSDRPRFIMAGEILTGGIFIAFSGYGELWRRMRRAAHEGLNIRASETYQPLQEEESAVLVSNLLQEPDEWDDHLKRSAASTVLSAVYGLPPIASKDDPLVTRINDLMHRLVRAALPGAYLVEIFPIMLYLPSWMAKWKREGLEWHRKDSIMFEGFMDNVQKKVETGVSPACFASSLVENRKQHNLTKKEYSWLAGTMFGAGAETTAAALSVFMLAMSLYPDVMRKAQAEIDAVVGRDRLPTFQDRDNLPYIRAMVKEVLRWRPVGPLGLPRRSIKDDWYNGYFIPKGTIVIANAWAMNRDPELFPDYDEFRPERFLDATGTVDQTPPDTHGQGHVTYGFGRRICVGMNVANQALFIDIASILWAVNIEKAVDANGKLIIPSRTECVDEGLVVRPVPFKCKITARSSDVPAMLEMAKAKTSL